MCASLKAIQRKVDVGDRVPSSADPQSLTCCVVAAQGVDFVVLAVGLTLGIGACAGCWVLYRLASRRKRMRKFGKLRLRDMLLFNVRPGPGCLPSCLVVL